MKKLISVLLLLTMVISLTGCGKKEETAPVAENAAEILNKIWANHTEEMLFPVMGGYDENFENIKSNEAGKFNSDSAEIADSITGIPADDFSKTDDIALIMHAMNANTFTATAFHVTDKNLVNTLASNYKENIMNRQWMCGFPDKLVVFTLEDYVLAFFGNEEIINNFKAKTTETYPAAKLAFEEMLSAGDDFFDGFWGVGYLK
ncbi:MAG: bacteriocin transport accessory protein [Lachnospiraceae bacterium]|nr:bacteriocin transport accessory protein [Lachnospiraceae bacterium]